MRTAVHASRRTTGSDPRSTGAIVSMATRESTAKTRRTTVSSWRLSARMEAPVSQTSPPSTLSAFASQDSPAKSVKRKSMNAHRTLVYMVATVLIWSTDSDVSAMGQDSQARPAQRTLTSALQTRVSMEADAMTLLVPSLASAPALLRASAGRDAMWPTPAKMSQDV